MGIRAVANYTGKRSCHRMPGGGFDSAQELITAFNGPKVWYDLSNVATLQQDSAGTIPVTAPGDPIGRVMDISGATNHATQATAANRPLWQTTYGTFDGVNDFWQTASLDFTSTDKVTIIAGVLKSSDASGALIAELSASLVVNPGTFGLLAPASVSPGYGFQSKGTVAATAAVTTGFPAPATNVLTGIGDISTDRCLLRVNSIQVASHAIDQGTGPYGNFPLYIGARGGTVNRFTGRLYGLIIIGRLLSTAELAMLEQYMAAKVGI